MKYKKLYKIKVSMD